MQAGAGAAAGAAVFSFLAMILVEEIVAREMVPGNIEKDVLVMGWEERRRARQRVFTRAAGSLPSPCPREPY